MWLDTAGSMWSAKGIQLGYAVTKTTQSAPHHLTNIYFWLQTQNLKELVIVKNIKKLEG